MFVSGAGPGVRTVTAQCSESVDCGPTNLNRSEGVLEVHFVTQLKGYSNFGLVIFLYGGPDDLCVGRSLPLPSGYINIYMYMSGHVYMYMFVSCSFRSMYMAYVYIHMYTQYIFVYMCVYMYMYVYSYVYDTHVHMYVCTRTHILMNIQIHYVCIY